MDGFKDIVLNEAEKYRKRTSCRSLHVAILFTGKGKILSIGVNNHSCTHKTPLHHLLTIHAEMDAIYSYMRGVTTQKIKHFKRKSAKIAVFRITPGGNIANSLPCLDCLKKAHECGIRKIYWSVNNNQMASGRPDLVIVEHNVNVSNGNRKNMYAIIKDPSKYDYNDSLECDIKN